MKKGNYKDLCSVKSVEHNVVEPVLSITRVEPLMIGIIEMTFKKPNIDTANMNKRLRVQKEKRI